MSSNRVPDGNGWIEVKDNPISKEGVFKYSGASLARRDSNGTIINGIDPNKLYNVYRPAEELSSPEAIESFKLLPWTDDHPDKLLGPESLGRRPIDEKGMRGVTGQEVYFRDGVLYANIKILSEYLKGLIDAGKKELSAGYSCIYEIASGIWNGVKYDAIQRNIRGNHVALVQAGRMGPDVAVLDHLTFTFDAKELNMADEKKDDEKKAMDARMAAVCDWAEGKMAKDAAEEKEAKEKSEGKDGKASEGNASEGNAVDAEEAKKKLEADKAAKDAEEAKKKDDEKKEGMDAAVELKRVSSELATLKNSMHKSLLSEITQRDSLAADLSRHIGTFDHADKTLAEVSAYGVKTLGIKCPAGQEAVALSAYLEGRKAVGAAAGMDASVKKRTSAVDKFITGE